MRHGTKRATIRQFVALRRSICASVLTLLCLVAVCAPSPAQVPSSTQLKLLDEWKTKGVDNYALPTISPDGSLVAHMQYTDSGPVPTYKLFVKNLTTGDDKLVLSNANGQLLGGWVGFSPDGSRLIVDAWGPAVSNGENLSGKVYTAKTDGTDLVRLAPGDATRATYCKANAPSACAVTMPSYSPDGSQIIVQVATNPGSRGQDGRLNDRNTTAYVGLLTATAQAQEPQQEVEGRPIFWSSDGKAIYYDNGSDPMIYRLDLQTKQSVAAMKKGGILGKVPGTDALFVSNGQSIGIANLQPGASGNTRINAALTRTLASIPIQDAEQRELGKIEASRDGTRLLLAYYGAVGGHGSNPAPWGESDQHVQIVAVQ